LGSVVRAFHGRRFRERSCDPSQKALAVLDDRPVAGGGRIGSFQRGSTRARTKGCTWPLSA